MSDSRVLQYEIIPSETYKIIRNCSGCGGKNTFINTGRFRVNANGSRLDVWLIYQCEKCRHTYKLTIYERISSALIPARQYQKFLANDKELADEYGWNLALTAANKAEIRWDEAAFQVKGPESAKWQAGDCLVISNPRGMRMRTDKAAALILGLTRNKVRQLQKKGIIKMGQDNVGREAEVRILGSMDIQQAGTDG